VNGTDAPFAVARFPVTSTPAPGSGEVATHVAAVDLPAVIVPPVTVATPEYVTPPYIMLHAVPVVFEVPELFRLRLHVKEGLVQLHETTLALT